MAPSTAAVAAVSGIYSSQEENYGNFTTSAGGGNTMHNPRNYGKSRTSGHHVQQQQQQQQGLPTPEEQLQRQMISDQYSSHGQLISNNPPPGGSSYANFNLSTIFPEIHVPGPGNAKLDPGKYIQEKNTLNQYFDFPFIKINVFFQPHCYPLHQYQSHPWFPVQEVPHLRQQFPVHYRLCHHSVQVKFN